MRVEVCCAIASYYWRVATTGGWLLLEGGYYWRVATTGGWLLLEGGYTGGWLLLEGSYYWRVIYSSQAHCYASNMQLLCEGSDYLRVASV